MNAKFQKSGALLAAICISATMLAGCQHTSPDPAQSIPYDASSDTSQEPTAVVTDVDLSEAEVHEVIAPQQFTEGEVIDNPYYKRTMDENGTPVFAVIKAGSGQPAYLPFSETTVYHTESGSCYYERKVLTYKLDGVEKTTTQYELWVADTVLEDAQTGTGAVEDAGVENAGDPAPDEASASSTNQVGAVG